MACASTTADSRRAKEAPMQQEYIEVWDRLEKKFDGTPGVK